MIKKEGPPCVVMFCLVDCSKGALEFCKEQGAQRETGLPGGGEERGIRRAHGSELASRSPARRTLTAAARPSLHVLRGPNAQTWGCQQVR